MLKKAIITSIKIVICVYEFMVDIYIPEPTLLSCFFTHLTIHFLESSQKTSTSQNCLILKKEKITSITLHVRILGCQISKPKSLSLPFSPTSSFHFLGSPKKTSTCGSIPIPKRLFVFFFRRLVRIISA